MKKLLDAEGGDFFFDDKPKTPANKPKPVMDEPPPPKKEEIKREEEPKKKPEPKKKFEDSGRTFI